MVRVHVHIGPTPSPVFAPSPPSQSVTAQEDVYGASTRAVGGGAELASVLTCRLTDGLRAILLHYEYARFKGHANAMCCVSWTRKQGLSRVRKGSLTAPRGWPGASGPGCFPGSQVGGGGASRAWARDSRHWPCRTLVHSLQVKYGVRGLA